MNKSLAAIMIFLLCGCATTATAPTHLVDYENGESIPGEDVYLEDIVAKAPAHLIRREPSQAAVSGPFPHAPMPGAVFASVTNAQVLMELERRGFRLEDLLVDSGRAGNLKEFLARSSVYRDFVQAAEEDVAASVEEENEYRPDWGKVGTDFKAKRRQFDPKWLASPLARFELVGLVNRMDREIFNDRTCGEMRLIYRMSYQTKKVSSRLPLTVNLVYYLPRTGPCRDLLKEWTAPKIESAKGFAAWLQSEGPLRGDRASLARLKSLETNYQVIRSSSGIRNLLGGHAEYILRAFRLEGGRLVRAKLENTIDPERFKSSPAQKERLLSFLKRPENFEALDRGVLKIDDEFLATAASSFSPHGISRYDNRPYDKVFTEADFADLDYGRNKFVKTPDAVLRRLNDLSCIGCHQNRTTAGFHFLGEDRPETHPLNAILFAGSGHFRAELKRHQAYLETLAKGGVPSPERPFSIAPVDARAHAGDFCGLPGSKGFSDWRCEDGLRCVSIDGAVGEKELGKCAPDTRLSGDPCLVNQVIQNHHSLDKMVQPVGETKCAGGDPAYTCQIPGGGFPVGMCTSTCAKIKDLGREICGPMAGPGFHDCLAAAGTTFFGCLEKVKGAAARGRCNERVACRNDYICARVTETEGACLPSYFLYQIRVDGHPNP